MFSIETNNGKLIRPYSYFQQEDEILLPPGIYLQVIDKFSSADGLNIIQLQEIPPPYKTLADPFDLSQLERALPQPQSSAPTSSSQEKQGNYSTANVTLEGPVETSEPTSNSQEKQGKFSTANVTPKEPIETSEPESSLQKKQEYYSKAYGTLKGFVNTFWKKGTFIVLAVMRKYQ